ncbi:Arc family DNA-binding protein [Morganella morganii subsp. morganii]|uniref:Arc family DNA-binding protein n=1 Tax=Morganella morganii TaxID=582 RepID=UPI001BD9E2B7|nr:Arc family DNA-binding protein [Morganella morganii]MBT0353115.1 Arc family DNA-binding protein [Morganella morganii subsp. morganii]
MAKYPSQLQDKFNLRLPDGMKDAIAERAKENGRSINSEIVQILQDALIRDDISNVDDFDKSTPTEFKIAARRMILALEEFEEQKRKLFNLKDEGSGINLLNISPKK